MADMCGLGGEVFVAVLACVRSTPGEPVGRMPVVTTLLPSLARSVARRRGEFGGRVCIYLCAEEDDEWLLAQMREFRHKASAQLGGLGMRLLFFPGRTPVREAAAYAYADGARYFHHTYDDVTYTDAKWLGKAIGALDAGGTGVIHPTVERATSALGAPAVLARTHLDVFHELYPPQCPGWALDTWLSATYASTPLAPHDLGSRAAGQSASRAKHPHPQLLPALVECGRHVVAAAANRTSATAQTSRRHANGPSPLSSEWDHAPVSCIVAVGHAHGAASTGHAHSSGAAATGGLAAVRQGRGAPDLSEECRTRARPAAAGSRERARSWCAMRASSGGKMELVA